MSFGTSAEVTSYVATTVGAIVATYYAYLTRLLVVKNSELIQQNQAQLENQQRPYVDVSIITPEGLGIYQLRVVNNGMSSAQNLHLRMTPDFYMFGEKSQAPLQEKAALFTREMPSVPPRTEFLFDLEATYVDFEDDVSRGPNPPVLMVTASYSWSGHNYEQSTTLDLRLYKWSSATSSATLAEVKKLNDNLGKLVDAVKKLQPVENA